MGYCRYCGTEITFKRTKNEKWVPCDAATGEPHFCNEEKEKPTQSGLGQCPVCGKPVFKNGRTKKLIDYTTLELHICRKMDITRFAKYQQRVLKTQMTTKAKERKNGRKVKSL